MKKEVFIRLFKIEESIVKSINKIDNDLIIKTISSVNSFAMGNNIRENEFIDVENTYIFKNITELSNDSIYRTRNIYNTTFVNNLICFDTNEGFIYFSCSEIFIK
ncbi:MAG: hypothetical protein IJB21_02125 [Bacilli bacterium]|nr:hypothetical protein [Bacilli bacterium]